MLAVVPHPVPMHHGPMPMHGWEHPVSHNRSFPGTYERSQKNGQSQGIVYPTHQHCTITLGFL